MGLVHRRKKTLYEELDDGVPLLSGGVPSVIYGDPRFTRGIDVVLELQGSGIDGLISAFSSEDYYVPPIEALRELEYFQLSGSDRHLRDVAMMLEISGTQVNQIELDRWVERLGLNEAWVATGVFDR